MFAINQLGTSTPSSSQSAHTFGAPEQISTTSATSTSTSNTISWTAPDDHGSPITSYRINVLNSQNNWLTLATVSGSTTTYTQTNAISNTLYTYTVTAINPYGSSTSASIPIHSKPVSPTLSGVTQSGTQVNLSWTAQSGVPVTFNLYKSNDGTTYSVLQSGLTSTSFNDTTLSLGETAHYKVSAVNPDGESSQSSALQISTFSLPSAPMNLQLANPTSLSVRLSWSTPTSNGGDSQALTYTVQSSTDSIAWSTLTQTTSLGYITDTLTPSTAYYYKVYAENRAGIGQSTSVVSYATPSLPEAPTNLTVTPTGSTNSAVKLNWGAGTSTQGNPIIGYRIDRSENNGGWNTIVSSTENSNTFYTNTGLTAGTTYTYRVYTVSSVGTSLTSTNLVSIQLLDIDITLSGQALTGNTVQLNTNVVVNGGNPLPNIVNIAVYQNNVRIDNDAVSLPLQSQTLPVSHAYPTVTSDFYITITLANGMVVKSNTISLTPTAPFTGELTANEYRDNTYEQSTLSLSVQPLNADVIVRYQPQGLNDTPILRGYTSSGNQTLVIDLVGQQGDPTYNPDASSTDYYGSVYVNPAFNYTISSNGTVTTDCDTASPSCDPNDIPNGIRSTMTFKSLKSPDSQPQLGLESMGDLFGMPLVFVFVIALGAVFTGRSAQMGVIFIVATIGIMVYMGYVSFDFGANGLSEAVTWGLIVVAMIAGVLVGKRWS